MVAVAKRGAWPQDQYLWQIQCFGEMDRAPGTPSELAQHLLLRLIPERGLDPPQNVTRIVHVGAGLIPSLSIGQQWRNQRLVGLQRFKPFDDDVEMGGAHWRFADGMTKVGANEYLIPPFTFPLNPLSRIPFLAIAHQGVPDSLLIPCTEIARTWYFRSTALVHRFTEAPLDEEGLDRFCRLDQSGMAPDGSWTVEGRTGFSETDLPFVAMLKCNHLAFQRAKGLMDSLVEAKTRGAPCYMRVLPPLDGRCRLKAEGIQFLSGGVRRFLILRINEASFPPNPGLLHGDFESSNNAINLGQNELKNTKWPRKTTRHASQNDSVDNNQEPNLDLGHIYEYGMLPTLSNMPVFRKLPPREQTTTNAGRDKPPTPEGEASTGQGNYTGGNNTAPLRVKDTQPRRRAILPADFNQLLLLGIELKKLPGLSCHPVRKSTEFAGSGVAPRSLFPEIGKGKRRWAQIDFRPRQYMALEISGAGKCIYVVEIERRPKTSSSVKGECFALGILMADDGRKLSINTFGVIMTNVIARRGVWPKSLDGIHIQKADHRSPGILRFAKLIASKIYKWVPALRPTDSAKPRDSTPSVDDAACLAPDAVHELRIRDTN